MCLKKLNKKQPISKRFFKVFRENEGKIYNLKFNPDGSNSLIKKDNWGTELIKGEEYDSVQRMLKADGKEYQSGFHVFETIEAAEIFAKGCNKMWNLKDCIKKEFINFVVREIECSELLATGMNYSNPEEFMEGNPKLVQCYVFKKMRVNER